MKSISLALTALIICAGCTEVTQTIQPSPVTVEVSQPTAPDEPAAPNPAGDLGTITLEPASGEVAVSKNVNVMVIVKDSGGVEIPSENISVNIIDKDIVELVEIDGRILTFGGVAAGITSVIITASGLQTSIVITVVP